MKHLEIDQRDRNLLGSRCARSGNYLVSLSLAFAVLTLCGCSRSRYRERADAEVYSLVAETASDPRWPLYDYTIEPSDRSRFYDSYPPDFEELLNGGFFSHALS